MNLFIDTNVLLSFYHLTSEDLEELRKLAELQRRGEVKLHVPDQVKRELERNREAKIADAMKKLREQRFNFTFPQMCQDYEEFSTLRDGLKACDKAHQALVTKLEADILSQELEADKTIAEVFAGANHIPRSGEVLSKAKLRKELRDPPGKHDSLGDAINWETLIDAVPSGEDLYLISEDGDFQAPLGTDRLNPYLAAEWRTAKEADVHFYRRISDFFREQYPTIKLAGEVDKELKIRALANSPNFATTHSIVASLRNYGSDFSKAQLNSLVSAITGNSQVHWIINDYDIRQFVRQLIRGREDEVEPIELEILWDFLTPDSPPPAKEITEQDLQMHQEDGSAPP